MPKRKRDGHEVSASTETHSRTLVHSNEPARAVDKKIHHARKGLHRALKVAKGFERQKLGRRRKDAVRDENDGQVLRLDAEVQALKTLDLNAAAETHLYKTLLKENATSTSPLLPSYVVAKGKLAQDTPTANVTARLYNSKPVKEALMGMLPAIRYSMGLGVGVKSETKGRKSKREADLDVSIEDGLEAGDGMGSIGSESSASASELEEKEADRRQESFIPSVAEDPADDDENFASFDNRVDSDDESASDLDKALDGEPTRVRGSNPTLDLSLSPSPSSSHSSSPTPPGRAKQSVSDRGRRADAMFIPSLTMGGYLSGSDSGSEPELDIEAITPPRKNRRGQRARQQIWEKKYGKYAKHLQKQSRGKRGRDQGWDLKRGAQMESEASHRRGYQPRWMQRREVRGKKGNIATGGNLTEVAPRPSKARRADNVDDSGSLHPSWEAAKKAKEQRQTGSFEGKKVVFD